MMNKVIEDFINSEDISKINDIFYNITRKEYAIRDNIAHSKFVAERTYDILKKLGETKHNCEIGYVAGYLHDFGSIITDEDHAEVGGTLCVNLLHRNNFSFVDGFSVASIVGMHHQKPTNKILAALKIADSTALNRNLIKENADVSNLENLDKATYSVISNELKIIKKDNTIKLFLVLEKDYLSILDFFNVFMHLVKNAEEAGEFLGYKFMLNINGHDFSK